MRFTNFPSRERAGVQTQRCGEILEWEASVTAGNHKRPGGLVGPELPRTIGTATPVDGHGCPSRVTATGWLRVCLSDQYDSLSCRKHPFVGLEGHVGRSCLHVCQ